MDNGSLNFARVIGSIGAAIEPEFDQVDDEFAANNDYEPGDGHEADDAVIEGMHYA